MFEKFVLGKIQTENTIINNFWESILSGNKLLKEAIVGSNLSDFTKTYIISDLNETVDKDELQQRIEKGNKLYFNYTLRPKWTILTFLFNNFESRPPNEILKKLRLFPFYNFYTDAINDFINKNSQIFSTKAEITDVIDQTDRAVYQKLTTDINNVKIRNFFLQIFKLKYEEDKYNLESAVPYSFIKIYLEDKSYFDLLKKFTVIKIINDEYEISLKDIIKVLTDKYNIPEKENIKEKEKAAENTEDQEIILTDVSYNKIIKKEEKEKIALKQTEPENSGFTKISQSEKIYSEQLLKAGEEKNASENDNIISPPDYDVKNLFNGKHLEKITDKVYNSDLIYRDKSFTKLNHYKTWSEASNHMKDIFKINKVDLYSKEVISFINILNEFFQNRE